ncbi:MULTISPECIES: GldL-related protein [Chitinophagaceae]
MASTSSKTQKVDRIMDIIVSAAAVPVLLGALFKILHAPGANTWITVGLVTEAGIFALYAVRYILMPVDDLPVETTVRKVVTEEVAPKPAAPAFDFAALGLSTNEVEKIKEKFVKIGDEHAGQLEKFYAQLNDASSSLVNSTTDAQKAQQELSTLADNLGKLNEVYGKMLTAMNAK